MMNAQGLPEHYRYHDVVDPIRACVAMDTYVKTMHPTPAGAVPGDRYIPPLIDTSY